MTIFAASYLDGLWQKGKRKTRDFYKRLDANANTLKADPFNEQSIA